MKHLGLFEGIGGFSLAARWMGWETVAWCEWNEFGQRVLRHHFPEAIGHGDITKTDFTPYANKIGILTGGFPCQPYSQAGKRLGKDDERHLFPEMLRAIREIKPTYVVGENVYGLTNWNGGVVFEEVCADLEAEGYEVQPVLLPASGIGAPHHRMRVWFVAYRNSRRLERSTEVGRDCEYAIRESKFGLTPDTDIRECSKRMPNREFKNTKENRTGLDNRFARSCDNGYAPNPDSDGQHQCDSEYEVNTSQGGEYAFNDINENDGKWNAPDTDSISNHSESNIGSYTKIIEQRRQESERLFTREFNGEYCKKNGYAPDTDNERLERGKIRGSIRRSRSQSHQLPPRFICSNWENFPTQSPICSGDDGLPSQLDGITFPKWRAESIKAYGNAIVPQVALQIFKAIEAMSFQQD